MWVGRQLPSWSRRGKLLIYSSWCLRRELLGQLRSNQILRSLTQHLKLSLILKNVLAGAKRNMTGPMSQLSTEHKWESKREQEKNRDSVRQRNRERQRDAARRRKTASTLGTVSSFKKTNHALLQKINDPLQHLPKNKNNIALGFFYS